MHEVIHESYIGQMWEFEISEPSAPHTVPSASLITRPRHFH